MMMGRFEWWFKQRDESSLNCVYDPRDSGNPSLGNVAATGLGRPAPVGFASTAGCTIVARLSTLERGVGMKIYRRTAAALWFSAVGMVSGTGAIGPALAADPLGTWFTADNESQVRIVNCSGAICGTLVWLKEPNDPATGQPKKDKHNADESKQGRPLLGVPIVLGMKANGTSGQWSGEVYNASDGKTYTGSFTMTGPNTAELKGCVLSVICKSQSWTRAN